MKSEMESLQTLTRFERVPVRIFPDARVGSQHAAKELAVMIRDRAREKRPLVLGLATGSSPVTLYQELVRMHRREGLSFRNVITFNLDEYYPMKRDALQSYHRFMGEHLFDHIDIKKSNIHIPDGELPMGKVGACCRDYERQIAEAGGLDVVILGIGRTGHIGFNEPGSPVDSITRLITLDHVTRTDAASDFYGEENVPRKAVTMGVGTILGAKRIILLAWGESKAKIIRSAVEEPPCEQVPAAYLQRHPNTAYYLDQASADELTRVKTPWRVGTVTWDNLTTRRAVVWLCQKLQKPLLRLTDRDYNDNGMSDLAAERGPAGRINMKVFQALAHTITHHPAGRPARGKPAPRRILVFSPHPDDDVICMGGTLSKLAEHGHEVHVAYQTSGGIAVFDDDVVRFAQFSKDLARAFGFQDSGLKALYKRTVDFLDRKRPIQIDLSEIQKIKTLIREGEAKAACRYLGIRERNIHFLNMPFYQTGMVKKKTMTSRDISRVRRILEKVRPHQVFAAGDLSDPHGTHRVCLEAIGEALNQLVNEKWMKSCDVWLYRGAWLEWDICRVEMAVPLSPEELVRKRRAIFKHQSQKDRPLFPGHDTREFWQRAEERNRETARQYDKFGLAEYEAIEAFVRYSFSGK